MTTTNDALIGSLYDGRYRMEKRIGSGGMANVYCAEDETLGRRVAIKVLHQRYAEDSQFVERFLREASAAARLSHPNIVQVYDRGQADGSYYIAMEFIDGLTLKDLVRRRNGLTEQEVLAYGRQALHALRSAHRNGIVHRDVKPHNMMVDTDGRLKIADFGIARAAADADQGLTEAGSIVGTAQYLSPEQAQGQDVGAPSDLYSLGVVMFEMATGRVPFDGESPVNVALKHVKDPVPRPSTFAPSISPSLESIILKAMEKDPARRYATADEMLADLDLARQGTATRAMTQVLGAAAVPVNAGTTTVSPIVPTPLAPRNPNRYDTPVLPPEPVWDDERARRDDRDDAASPWRWILPLLVVLLLAGAAAYLLLSSEGKEVKVPNVVGQQLDPARATITERGLEVGDVEERFDADSPSGEVLEQEPADGEAEEGTSIDLVVSKGDAPVPVPDVVGKTRAQAIALIRDAGFPAPRATFEFDDGVKAGTVIRQSPSAGTEAAEDTVVSIVVSKGEEKSTVPNVVGRNVDDARAILSDDQYGFTVNTETAESSQPAGTVIKQRPGADTPLAKGGTVTLTVASGRNSVPDVEGRQQSAAEQALRDAGFAPDAIEEPTDDPEQVGTVIRTDPGAGQTREVGSNVTIVIGTAREEAPPADPAAVQ